jgi:hypothetical protein
MIVFKMIIAVVFMSIVAYYWPVIRLIIDFGFSK